MLQSPAFLRRLLCRFYRFRFAHAKEKFGRGLPFGDLVADRWEKAAMLGFGSGASIYDSALVIGDVKVGERTWIGPHTVLDGSHGLSIGSFCSISAGAQIYTHDSVAWALSGGKRPYAGQPTIIGDNVYIGPQAVIQAGSTIGDHCVIGAGSFVRGSIPAWSAAFGVPAVVAGAVILDDSAKGWRIKRNEQD